MLLLQVFPTIGVTIIALIVGVLLARAVIAGQRSKPLLLLIALMFSVGFGYLWLLPLPLALPTFWSNVARALSIPSVGLCWWFACSLLDDRFRIGALQWFGLIAVCVFPAYYFLHALGAMVPQWPTFVLVVGSVPPLVLCAHMLWMAISGFRDDLLEGRRRFRLWIVAVIAFAIFASLLAEEIDHVEAGNILRACFAFFATLLVLFWLVKFSHEALAFETTLVETSKAPVEHAVDPRDQAALAKLDLFDRLQLEAVIRVCKQSRTLSDAGRKLYNVSREERSEVNDADRLRKYLARFGLKFDSITNALA